jgi:hypothetical protein
MQVFGASGDTGAYPARLLGTNLAARSKRTEAVHFGP